MIRLCDILYKGEWILCEGPETYKEEDEGGWGGSFALCLSEVGLPLLSYMTHKALVTVHSFHFLVLNTGKGFTGFGLGWNLWRMNLEETF